MKLVVIEIRKDIIKALIDDRQLSPDNIVFLSEHNVSDSQQRTADLKMIAAIQKEAREEYRKQMVRIDKIEEKWKSS